MLSLQREYQRLCIIPIASAAPCSMAHGSRRVSAGAQQAPRAAAAGASGNRALMLWVLLVILVVPVRAAWYKPARGVSWQYQLSDQGTIAVVPGVTLYVIDLDTAKVAIPTLKGTVPGASAGSNLCFQCLHTSVAAFLLFQRAPVLHTDTCCSPPALPAADARVVCYFSAGSWERYHVALDRKRGIRPAAWGNTLGKTSFWAEERWLDIRCSNACACM
jgi:hypothetical protein